MNRKLNKIRFKRIIVVVKITSPPYKIEQEIAYPKQYVIDGRYRFGSLH